MSNKPYRDIAADSAAANRGNIPVDVYGNKAPVAAKFGVGATDRAGAQQAQDARREVPPGVYGTKR